MTMHWTRKLYDFYAAYFSNDYLRPQPDDDPATWLLVLDADDVMTRPSVLVRFCDLSGLDSTRLRFEWEKENRDYPRAFKVARTTLDGSTEIDTSEVAGVIELDMEAEQWERSLARRMAA
jgi:hypothetical protein